MNFNSIIISTLPDDILLHIAMQLPLEDIMILCNTDNTFKKICNNNHFWKLNLT